MKPFLKPGTRRLLYQRPKAVVNSFCLMQSLQPVIMLASRSLEYPRGMLGLFDGSLVNALDRPNICFGLAAVKQNN